MGIRYIIIVLLALWVLRAIMSMWKRTRPRPGISDGAHRGMLLADPVCGCMVEKNAAVVVTYGGRKLFFCSKECAERYRED